MARQRGFPLVRGKRRKTAWGVGPESINQAINSTAAVLWGTGSALAAQDAVTIVRIRGFLQLMLTSTSVAQGGFRGAVGIGIVNDNAFTVGGVASILTPLTDDDWDGWMWHSYLNVNSVTATIADGANAVSAVYRTEIDTKAMRKFNSDEVVMGVIEVAEVGTEIAVLSAQTRMLLKLA